MRTVVVALLALAGCLEPSDPGADVEPHGPAEDTDQPAPRGEFWFVEVRGRHEEAPREGMACGAGHRSPPQLDVEARTIQFLNERFDLNATDFMVVGIIDARPCSSLVTTVVPSPHASAAGTFLGFGEVVFAFHDGGAVEVLGHSIDQGQSAAFNRTGQTQDGRPFQANLTVLNHGMWPKSGVTMPSGSD